jgi:hypothetical protein
MIRVGHVLHSAIVLWTITLSENAMVQARLTLLVLHVQVQEAVTMESTTMIVQLSVPVLELRINVVLLALL